MPDEMKTCRFYHFIQCGEANCCQCAHHPLNPRSREFMPVSERVKLAESCTVWLRAHNLQPTPENIIEALFQNNAIQTSSARLMIEGNPPALPDTLRG